MNLPQAVHNLSSCLDLLERYDNEEVDLETVNPTLTFEQIKDSIDAIYFSIEKAKLISQKYEELIASMKARKSLLEKNLSWFENQVRFAMKGRAEKLPGNFVRAQLNKGRKKVVPYVACTSEHLMSYPDCVRVKYDWDKEALAAAINQGKVPAVIAEVIEGEPSLRFYPIDLKGARNDRSISATQSI